MNLSCNFHNKVCNYSSFLLNSSLRSIAKPHATIKLLFCLNLIN